MSRCYKLVSCNKCSTVWKYYSLWPFSSWLLTTCIVFCEFYLWVINFHSFFTVLFLFPLSIIFPMRLAASGANAAVIGNHPTFCPFPNINLLLLKYSLLHFFILWSQGNTICFVYSVFFVIHYESFIRYWV